MNIFLIKLLGFLIGLFITLLMIDYFDITRKKLEKFENNIKNVEKMPVVPVINNNNNEESFIPYKSFKFMCINTFFDITKIDNNLNRWYECDLDKKKFNTISTNENHYFMYDKIINIKPNTINDKGSYGADINGIELRGPKSFYFANNIDNNELTEFTMLMSIKIKDITSTNNILFELAGNTEIVNNEKPTYLISMVNINIKINKVNNYDFIITVGDSIYSGEIDNIEKSTLKNNDFIVIGLIYTSSEITFTINKQIYKYKTKDKFKVKLGSAPIIINKKGLMNIQLYSFVFYKVLLPSSEYSLFLKHNYYYLSGLNNIINKSSEQPLEIPDKIELRNDIDTRLRELENKIDDKINKKIENQAITQTEIKYEEIKPFDIQKIENTDVNSPLNVLF
jgi:hypothetical protein